MKAYQKTLVALIVSSVAAVSANAAVTYGAGAAAGQPYVGVKVGQIDPDALDISESAIAYGVYGGYNFDQNFGAEVEYVGSDSQDYTYRGNKWEYDAKSYGAYGTYRYHLQNTPFYVKGRLGVAKTEIDDKNLSGSQTISWDKTSLAGGVGLGFQPTSNIGVEASYNYLNADTNALTIGAHVAF